MLGLIRKITGFIREKAPGGEAVRYIVVGVLTTLVNYCLFTLMTWILGIDVTVSNVTAIAVSILFAYVANKTIVFRRHSDTKSELALEFVKFVGSRLFTMAIEVGAVYLFVNVLGKNEQLGKLVAMALVVVLNYFISKLIVFRGANHND